MIFRALTIFSHHSEPSPPSRSFRDISNGRINVVTPPPEYAQAISEDPHELCRCRFQQDSYCPYCDIRDPVPNPTMMLNALDGGILPLDMGMGCIADSHTQLPVRRRKLQKTKPDYQKLQYEPSAIRPVVPGRPESILSAHSRTALLNPSLPTIADYPELPTARRNPNKLAKRNKMRKSLLTMDFSPVSSNASAELGRDNLQHLSRISTKISDTPEMILGSMDTPAVPPLSQPSSSIGTNDLVSLAWTGGVQPSAPKPESFEHLSQRSAHTNSSEVTSATDSTQTRHRANSLRQRVLRKPKSMDANRAPLPLPFSLAVAITDDKITDEKLVDQLEDMRIKEHPQRSQSLALSVSCPSPSYQAILSGSYAEYPPEPNEFFADEPSETSWNAARQALLLCREILRTERRYLSSLKMLAKRGTATPPPPSMLYYLPRLLLASDGFLKNMTRNPSVQGVSEAFLASQSYFDEAFVSWCSVVGSFFCDDDIGLNSITEDTLEHPFAPERLRRSTSAPACSLFVDSAILTLEPNKIRRNSKGRRSVRELAILPTQRILRYVLLFKGR